MADNPLVAFIEKLRDKSPKYDWQPTSEPPDLSERVLRPCDPPILPQPAGTLDEARALIKQAILNYLENPVPDHMLLIRALPGTGKTTAAVSVVDDLAEMGYRVGYAGPRHDFFQDVIAKSGRPEQWYEWLPRQAEDVEKGKLQTCIYQEQINEWLQRGYEAMDFCSGVCGWDYVNKACPYHAQKGRMERVIYIQHQHVTLGHPLSFDVLIGDENPAGAFAHEWRIPAKWVCPPGMDATQPLTEMLHLLSAICQATPRPVQGDELLEALGGAQAVLSACKLYEIPIDLLASGDIHRAEEAGSTPYFHLPALVALLAREAAQNGAGPQRIIASDGHLTLLLRRKPNAEKLPAHIIWLDATGKPEIYKQLFGRRVETVDAQPAIHGKIYQVIDRTNSKQQIQPNQKERARRKLTGDTEQAIQARKLIETIIGQHGYERPSLITFKDFDSSALDVKRGHFYAARGTNEHENADAVFILGAPQADIYGLIKLAKMIYFERETSFNPVWCVREQIYAHIAEDGLGRSYPVSGFWQDPDLQVILEMIREDEIVQAAHRGRPVNHPTDIWLLTNIPIWSLPPDELLTMRGIMDAPEGVNIWKWNRVQRLLDERDQITISDLVALGLHYETANEYFELIPTLFPEWEKTLVKTSHGGKPKKVVVKSQSRITH